MTTKRRTSRASCKPKNVKQAAAVLGYQTQRILGLPGVFVVSDDRDPKLQLRKQLGMAREVFSRLVNVSPRAIADVEIQRKKVAKLQRPYNEVDRLFRALSEVVEPDSLGDWFVTPNEAFGGSKPLEVIERGEIDRLWEMVYRLRSGIPG